ncbi:hypothetical protein [Actinoplanes sp. G11-F43]|uniref:hypothetical protein n=1 Tax=Actinoplanes sp. G11-F43 TaxID=3424130 RepID=UPI003D33F3C9
MVTDTPQPQETKGWLIEQRLRALPTKTGRDAARGLMLGAVVLPDRWLSEQQRAFLLLGPDEILTAGTRRAGAGLIDQVIHLSEQVIPAIVEDCRGRHALTPFRERRVRAVIREVLFLECPGWPAAQPHGLVERLRPAVDAALTADRADPALIRVDRPPADQRDHDEKMIVYATRDRDTLDRYRQLIWFQEKIRTFRIAVSLIVAMIIGGFYVGLFVLVRHAFPDMSARDTTMVLAVAVGSTLGGTGIGLLLTRARRPGKPDQTGGEDPPRPENR